MTTIHDRLINTSIDVIKSIAADSVNREDGYKQNLQLLNGGIHYPNDYFDALTETNQKARIDHLIARDGFFNGYASPKHFDMVNQSKSPSGKLVGCFVLKKGVLPSDALKAMRAGISLIGCGEVCQIAHYCAVEEVLGTTKFNALFAADSPTPLMIGPFQNNPIKRLRTYFMKENPSEAEIRKGDLVYLHNAKSYLDKHSTGAAAGFNALCVGDTPGAQRFVTLGLSPDGSTHEQIGELSISCYNAPYRSLERMSEKTKKAFLASLPPQEIQKMEEMKDAQITPQEFKEQGGGKITLVCELDTESITALANSSLKKARELLLSFKGKRSERIAT